MVYEGYESDYFGKEVILTVAPTGGVHGKEKNPNLPEQPEEVAEDVRKCEQAGASVVHLHARDEEGEPTKDVDRFRELCETVQERCEDIVLNITTGGGSRFSREERLAPVLDIAPELASLDMGPLNHGQSVTSEKPREEHEQYARRMAEHGVKPEVEIFNPGQLTEVDNLIEKDLLEEPYFCNTIFGMQTGTLPKPRNVVNFADNLPDESEWTCMAVGKHQVPLTTAALVMGGHMRVGMEDSVYYSEGKLAESNAQLVRRAADIVEGLGRELATPDEVRELLNLRGT